MGSAVWTWVVVVQIPWSRGMSRGAVVQIPWSRGNGSTLIEAAITTDCSYSDNSGFDHDRSLIRSRTGRESRAPDRARLLGRLGCTVTHPRARTPPPSTNNNNNKMCPSFQAGSWATETMRCRTVRSVTAAAIREVRHGAVGKLDAEERRAVRREGPQDGWEVALIESTDTKLAVCPAPGVADPEPVTWVTHG